MNALADHATTHAPLLDALARVARTLGLEGVSPEKIAASVERMADFHGGQPCPVTGEPFAGWKMHPEHGPVPVYGDPADGHVYALPYRIDHNTIVRQRLDLAAGRWDFGVTDTGRRVIEMDHADLPAAELQRLQHDCAVYRTHAFAAHDLVRRVTALERGRDSDGRSLGPAGGMTWERVGRQAVDIARSAMNLWCVTFAADKSVHAAPTRELAEQAAAAYNERKRPELERHFSAPGAVTSGTVDDYLACVAPWPYSMTAWEEDVKRWQLSAWTGKAEAESATGSR